MTLGIILILILCRSDSIFICRFEIILTKRLHIAMRLFSNRSEIGSEGGEGKKAYKVKLSVLLMLIPYFDV